VDELELAAAACSNLASFFRPMSEPDPKTTLREFQEYLDLSYESSREIAARIGVAQRTIWAWLAGKSQPKAHSLAKLRRFLDNEAQAAGSG
jgi:transcriptional regulator with XRE-family HTH domain